MTNSIGYAQPATFDFGTLAFEKTRITEDVEHEAMLTIASWLPVDEAREFLDMLGLHTGRK